jgi:uncharacterized protein YjeT (DUF2065 family)
MLEFLAALGLAMVIEGVMYALAPEMMKRLLASMLDQPPSLLRYGGLGLAIVGLALVWAAKG